MKTFACVLLLAALVAAEPPRYNPARFRFARQELADSESKESGEPSAEDAPYPSSGYKPATEFKLPSRQEVPPVIYGVPADSYGPPPNTYFAPNTEYGIPEVTEGKNKKTEDESESKENREESEGKENSKQEKKGKLEEAKEDSEIVSGQGAYYVLLPGSQLQKIQFQTENDIRNMAYTARLQYKSEDRAPIYVYTAVPQYQPSAAYVLL